METSASSVEVEKEQYQCDYDKAATYGKKEGGIICHCLLQQPSYLLLLFVERSPQKPKATYSVDIQALWCYTLPTCSFTTQQLAERTLNIREPKNAWANLSGDQSNFLLLVKKRSNEMHIAWTSPKPSNYSVGRFALQVVLNLITRVAVAVLVASVLHLVGILRNDAEQWLFIAAEIVGCYFVSSIAITLSPDRQ